MTYLSIDPAAVSAIEAVASAIDRLAKAQEAANRLATPPRDVEEKPLPTARDLVDGALCKAFNPRTSWECDLKKTEGHLLIHGKTQHKTRINGETYDWFVEG